MSRLSIRMGIAFSVICFVSVGRVLFEILRTSDDGSGHRRTSYESFLFEFGAADGGGGGADPSSGGRPGCRFAFDRDELALRGTRLVGDLVNASLTCAQLRRPRAADIRTDDVWQRLVSADGDDIAVYSAFYDDRPAVGVTPWIRIIGVARLANRTHHCYVWYPNCDAPVVTPMVVNLTGRESGYTINRVRYVQYLFSCRLPGIEPIPTHVSVVGERCAPTTIYLPVERPIRAEPDADFGVCVAIAFGSVPTPVFAEWIEFGHLLGIAEFNVYDAGMTNMSAVFGHYSRRRRLLHVHRMPPPVPEMVTSRATNRTAKASPPTYGSVKLASPASLNDCLLRNMYRYRFVVVIDFDEVIVPRLHENYRQMLDHVDRKYRLRDRPYTYTFANTYYFLTFAQDPAQPTYMRTMRFRRRVPPSGHGLAPKSFVDPRSCLSVFNHYCLRPLRSPSTTLVHIHVSADIARSHHYRMCGFSNKTCTEYFQQETQDDIALRFKSRLQPAVEAALRQIGT